MSVAALESANTRLASSPEFDPAQSARLGLFVVARLAARHAVRVRLRSAEGSGVTAVVLVPADLVTSEPPAGPDPATLAATAGDRRLARPVRRGTVPRPRAGRTSPAVAATATDDLPTLALPTGPTPDRPSADGPGAGGTGADAPDVNGESSSDGTTDDLEGLPRRVRRRTPTAQPRSTVADAPSPRSPEEVRRVMAALQAGTARGRATVVAPGSAARGGAPGTTAPANRAGATPAAAGPAPAPPTASKPPTETERDA